MSTARLVIRRPRSLMVLMLVACAGLTSGGCNSTKPKEYTVPEHSQARCTESHSADGTCAAAEVADE